AQLEHPGIVPIYEVGEIEGQHFFSMMLIKTGCLKTRMQGQQLTPREASRMVSQIARIVQFAHSRNIVHRDLKPGNVLVDENGNPRLTDFGLAKDLTDHSHLTSDGQVMGTPSYMAPEQAAGRSEQVGPASDVYALGAILYHLVTGDPPFQEGSILKTLQQVVSDEPESPRKRNPEIGLDLATICLKCLEKAPELRYASAGELADDLDGYLRGEPISARAISWPERARRWCRRNPAPFYGTLATLVISCAAILYAAVTFDQEVDSFATTLDDVAWRSLHETADWVADSAERELQTKFRQVESAARNPVLKERLAAIVRDPDVYKTTQSEISSWEQASLQSTLGPDDRLPEVLMLLQRWISSDPVWTDGQSLQLPGQGPTLVGYDGAETTRNVIAWWVCGPDGYQIARSPWTVSQKRDFSFRSYFTGRNRDVAAGKRPEIAWSPGAPPRMSAVFRTQQTNYWVLAISAPIWDDETFLGVVGIFLRLGSFLERPEQDDPDAMSRYAVLLDPRDVESGEASVIEHPYHNLPIAKRDGRLRDDAATVRMSRQEWTPRISKDPLGALEFGAQDDFGGDWRSASAPVRLPGADNEFLLAMVRESVDLVQTPSRHLRTNLYWLGIAVAGLFVLPPMILLGLLTRLPPRAAT
ncbi:MAG: protein kinase, partial [Planctomycetaceae bacterium]